MGRSKKRRGGKAVYAGATRRVAEKRPVLLDRADLSAAWCDAGCSHKTAIASAYGLCANMMCIECGVRMTLRLVFGRPKKFVVEIYAGKAAYGLSGDARPVGYASARAAATFIHGMASLLAMPEGGADPEGESPLRDEEMLTKLLEVIYAAGPGRDTHHELAVDFISPWREIDCKHEHAVCQIHGSNISVECGDCATNVSFEMFGNEFGASMARMPLDPVQYGRHGPAAVVDFVREHVETLLLPDPMADRMSDDPERDARHVSRFVRLLEDAGVLRSVAAGRNDPTLDAAVADLSVMNCSRDRFDKITDPDIRAHAARVTENRENRTRIGPLHRLESMRLAWPHRYEGIGLDVEPYDPTGVLECCVRCGFSTLDDDRVWPDHWVRGCPECGYLGFLLDMD